MTIDEAIEQYKHIAVSYEKCGNTEDAMESRQVAEWLRQARGAEAAARWYTGKLRDAHRDMRKVLDENAKLRDLCEWLLNPYRLGAVAGEGVDKQWCRETYDGGSYRLRELGGEVE